MIYVPPETTEAKIEALKYHLPGVDLHSFMKGMPTALIRSQTTVPRGLNELKQVISSSTRTAEDIVVFCTQCCSTARQSLCL